MGRLGRDGQAVTTPVDILLSLQDLGVRVVFLMHHAGGIEWPAAALSYKHLLRHLAAQEEDELSDLGIAAARQTPLEMFIKKRDDARRQTQRPTQE